MYIDITTKQIWIVPGLDNPYLFLTKLTALIEYDSVLVVGSYDAGPKAEEWLEAHSSPVYTKPYGDSFDLNRSQYPKGKSWEIAVSDSNLQDLASLSRIDSGSIDKRLFFDHLLAYKHIRDKVVPLFEFHDAFSGGTLRISDEIERERIFYFCMNLGVSPSGIQNN
jgi:hypothetical protein